MTTISQLVKDFFKMMKSRDNPHEVTAEQLGSYSKSELDNALSGYLEEINMSIYKYGDSSWAPANVLGSFEGGTRLVNDFYFAELQEADGSVTLLENATNGVKSGVYYTFLNQINEQEWRLNPTPREYRLPKLEAQYPGSRVFRINNSDASGALWGQLRLSDGSIRIFIALTGGTANNTDHRAVLLDDSTGVWASTRCVLVGGYVYLLHFDERTTIDVYRISVTDIEQKDVVSKEHITGWKTTGILGKVYDTERIQYADIWTSKDPNAHASYIIDPLLNDPGPYNSVQCTVSHPTENKLRVLYQFVIWQTNSAGNGITPAIAHVFDIDFDTKTCMLVAPTNQPCKVVAGPDNSMTWEGTQLELSNKYGNVAGQLRGQISMLSDGRLCRFIYGGLGLGWWNLHGKALPKGDTRWDGIMPDKFINTAMPPGYNGPAYRRFGSLLGQDTFYWGMLPGGTMLVQSMGTDQSNITQPPAIRQVAVQTGTDINFTFETDNGPVRGFAPTTDVKEFGWEPGALGGTMLMTGIERKISKVTGAPVAPQRYANPIGTNLRMVGNQVNGGDGGYITVVNNSVFDKAIAGAIEHESRQSLALDVNANIEVHFEIWVPPSGTAMTYPAIAKINLRDRATLVGRSVFILCALEWATGNIDDGMISDIIPIDRELYWGERDGSRIGTSFMNGGMGYVYEHFQDGVHQWSVLNLPSNLGWRTVGGNINPKLRLLFTPGADRPLYQSFRGDSGWYTAQEEQCLVDGYGPVRLNRGETSVASGAAVRYSRIELNSGADVFWNSQLVAGADNKYMFITSQVAEGYEVYFTDETSCLIRSKYYEIGNTMISLSDLGPNPENKRYNVHLQLVDDVVSYVITPDLNAEYDLYIGYILTGATQIETINIAKVVKFGW